MASDINAWLVRDLHESDIEKAVRLYEITREVPDSVPLNLVDLLTSLRAGQPAVVAMARQDLIGFAVADLRGDRATLSGLRIHPQWRGQGIGSKLIRAIEDRLLHVGVRRIEALLGPGEVGEDALINRGFRATRGLTFFEKDEPLAPSEVSVLDAWGGELIDDSAWSRIAGMTDLKRVIEERVVRPILEDELARHFGLQVPSTVMLFGPPGTGKTSFARAVAGRLGWPFVELLPSKLASTSSGLAAELGRALQELGQLEHVVAFIDEFDEISAKRSSQPDTQGVVNELLKSIPPFRSQPGRLLVCATNFIERIDPAITRPGRFDLLVPVGPPDPEARAAMWRSALGGRAIPESDLDALVGATHGFTPADLFLASQRAAFEAFRRTETGAEPHALTTDDYLAAVAATRPSLDDETIAQFEQNALLHQRL